MKSLLILLFFGFSSLIQSQNKPLLLSQYLKSESESILKYGNESDIFAENNKRVSPKIVLKDFDLIRKLTTINLKDYKIENIREGKHQINIYKTDSKIKPYKIVEVITRDSCEYKGNKIGFEQIKYFFLYRSNPKKIEIDISENGIDSYTIDGKEKNCIRISVLYIPDNFDYSAFQEMDTIMEKYKDK